MCWRLRVGVSAVKMIYAIQQTKGVSNAMGLAVSNQRGVERRLGRFELFASLGGVACGKSSGELVSNLNEVFSSHGHWWKTSTLPD